MKLSLRLLSIGLKIFSLNEGNHMKREILRMKAVRALLVFSLLAGVAFIADMPSAQAQYRNDPYYGGGYNNIYRMAQDQGYRDGMEQGAKDGRDRNRYKPEDSGRYRDATRGYRSEYGNKDAYKQAYRDGFSRGYDQGFRQYTYGGGGGSNDPYYRNDDPYYRNDPYGRAGDYGNGRYGIYQVAQEQGYRDGTQRGAEDARNGDRYNPEGSSQYRNADRGYRDEYGNREEYRRVYRDAFRRGYDESYRRDDRGVYNRGGNSSDRARRVANILGTIFGRP